MGAKDVMAGRCPAFDRHAAEASGEEAGRREAWEAHLRSCASCRAQQLADAALREFLGGLPRPRLPASFARSCARRAAMKRD